MRLNRASWLAALCTLTAVVSLGACGDDDSSAPAAGDPDASLDATTPPKDGATSESSTSNDAATTDATSPGDVASGTSSPADASADAASDASTDAGSDAADADAADASTCAQVDWTTVTPGTSATGTIGSVNVTLTGADILSGATNGASSEFSSSALYSPPLATGDHLDVRGTAAGASYTLTFSAPVSNPRFYLKSFASTMTFGGSPTLTKISGDTALVASANVATGVTDDTTSTGYDTNGIIEYAGTVSSTTFTLTYATVDGIYLQVYACH